MSGTVTSQPTPSIWPEAADRPAVALITNHGYGGANIPFGGAPDTGGQNVYVNTLALNLERLGYAVTVFARGGFPHFESDRLRSAPELLSEHVRYVFVPGGGSTFLRKEDIAVALDEQVDWLDEFIRGEATACGGEPWDVYEFVNTHYWDAAVLGTRLVERWRDDVVERTLRGWLGDVVTGAALRLLHEERHTRAVGDNAAFHLGQTLMEADASDRQPIGQQVQNATARWIAGRGLDADAERTIVAEVLAKLAPYEDERDLALLRVIASRLLGDAIYARSPALGADLEGELALVDRHVWTPHSLGELKDYNYRERPLEMRRSLKFCERRSHERMVASRTRVFASTSAEITERLWTHYGVAAGDTFYFPPCVDGLVYRPYRPDETGPTYGYLAGISGLPEETLRNATIVFETSRMDRTKRKDLLLSAFERIAPACENVYVFIGGGPENDVFGSLRTQLDASDALRGRAFLTTAIPDEHMGPLFSIADVYATASEMEGFGMCASQAAAAGTPIVSTDTIPFSIHHVPEDVELFAPGDVEGLAGGIRRLLDDPELRRTRGARLRERVARLDWACQTERFVEYLRSVGIEVAKEKGTS